MRLYLSALLIAVLAGLGAAAAGGGLEALRSHATPTRGKPGPPGPRGPRGPKGEQGDQGPQRTFTPGDFSTVNGGTVTLGPAGGADASGSSSASCASGAVALSGGLDGPAASANVAVVRNRPLDQTTWQVSLVNLGASSVSFHAVVVCTAVGPPATANKRADSRRSAAGDPTSGGPPGPRGPSGPRGPRGSQGDPGGFDTNDAHWVGGEAATMNGPGSVGSSTATCPRAAMAIGGGWNGTRLGETGLTLPPDASLIANARVGIKSWRVVMVSHYAFQSGFKAVVRCVGNDGSGRSGYTRRTSARTRTADAPAHAARGPRGPRGPRGQKGPKGETGPPGSLPAAADYTVVVGDTTTVPPGEHRIVAVLCPTRQGIFPNPVGGGWEEVGSTFRNATVYSMEQYFTGSGAVQWLVYANNNGSTPASLRAVAVCWYEQNL